MNIDACTVGMEVFNVVSVRLLKFDISQQPFEKYKRALMMVDDEVQLIVVIRWMHRCT